MNTDPQSIPTINVEFTVEDRFTFRTNIRREEYATLASSDTTQPDGFLTYEEARVAAARFCAENGGGRFEIQKHSVVRVVPA